MPPSSMGPPSLSNISKNKGVGESIDIHYWIGNTSSQDEQASAAVYTTQLDEYLGGRPVQYREVEVSWNSFNNGDVFILDLGKNIVLWNSPECDRREKLKAMLLAQDIRDRERGGRADILIVEGAHEKQTPELVWRIENLELAEVQPNMYGQFYGGDCYLVLYSYNMSNKEQYILYMWQGRHATKDEITACAYQAVALDNMYNGAPVQVRVVMGKEPRHFLAIFKGKLIIYEGGTGRPGAVSPKTSSNLFQVRGTSEFNTKVIEVPARASCLSSNDVFMLKTSQKCYLWYGKIFLWVGRFANETETKESWISAQEYLKTHPAGRDLDTTIIFVKQGYEPLTFTGWFTAWDPFKWSVGLIGDHSSPAPARNVPCTHYRHEFHTNTWLWKMCTD
ncbi:hypothetical protein GOODEAATRI_001170 [Goodea atripinnis]|uniref:Gelsolin-like domain-containing protein n=1 Tax=Goodea atripinnis TaxID=208336 RepID=A0ABV0NHM3_9TELE